MKLHREKADKHSLYFTFSNQRNFSSRKLGFSLIKIKSMQESQQRLLDEQLQLSLDTNKTGVSISSHDSQIDVLDQYTKVC